MALKKSTQWEVVHGLLENAIYGGRIDDKQDQKKLKTFLQSFFCSEVFATDGKPALRKLCREFNIPKTNEHSEYKRIIDDLSDADNVVLFGLAANIDRTQQKLMTDSILSKMALMVIIS